MASAFCVRASVPVSCVRARARKLVFACGLARRSVAGCRTGRAPCVQELTRLTGMKSGSMKPELKQWLAQRLNILKQLDH